MIRPPEVTPRSVVIRIAPVGRGKKEQSARALIAWVDQSPRDPGLADLVPVAFVRVELRQLEAFVAVAQELHFGRAAARLHLGQPTLSDLVRRLERELGAPLLHRTTRRVVLTEAGALLLTRAQAVLHDVADAAEAVRAVGTGSEGTVRFGFTPPAAPTLAPHLAAGFVRVAPGVRVEQRQLWLPGLQEGLRDGTIDVAVTCGVLARPGAAGPDEHGVVTHGFASEPLLVGLRPGHRLAAQPAVDLHDLAGERLGQIEPFLFPAWAESQRSALEAAGVAPPVVALTRTDLNAAGWAQQRDVDWVLLIGSLTAGHDDTVIRPVTPAQDVVFVLQWLPSRARSPAVARFVDHVLTAPLPDGWQTQPGHRLHAADDVDRLRVDRNPTYGTSADPSGPHP